MLCEAVPCSLIRWTPWAITPDTGITLCIADTGAQRSTNKALYKRNLTDEHDFLHIILSSGAP